MRFFDLQVNGYAGVDFNCDRLCISELEHACQRLRDDGVAGCLATVISADLDRMTRCLSRLAIATQESELVRSVIHGLHIEGPFLNPETGYVGAHPPSSIRPATVEVMCRLLEAANGLTRLVTLAPECDPGLQVTSLLVQHGITVSAGHCNPTRSQLIEAIDAGLTMFTHLGNGCPANLPRHDNIIQLVLSLAERLWIMFIADGVHIPFHALKNYLHCTSVSRAIIVTDAISAAAMGPGIHRIGEQEVVVDEHLATWARDRSHLVGSAMTMPQVVENLATHLQLGPLEIAQLTYVNPRNALCIAEPFRD